MISAQCSQMSFYNSSTANILQQIAYPIYPDLIILNLKQNLIQNIQSLAFLKIPNLVSLNLETNNITSIQPINRLNLPKLNQLLLSQNPIEVTLSINRLKCDPKSFYFDLFQQYCQISKYMNQDLSFYPKFYSNMASEKQKKKKNNQIYRNALRGKTSFKTKF